MVGVPVRRSKGKGEGGSGRGGRPMCGVEEGRRGVVPVATKTRSWQAWAVHGASRGRMGR
jgi:hypothetical protein